MSELQQRVPGHSLIEKLIREFEAGRIRVEQPGGQVVIDDASLSWYQGVLGEREVGSVLQHLGSEFDVLHAVPFKKREADIDHVVIGPAGVTIINAKHTLADKVWSAGYGIYVGGSARKGYIPNLADSVREAERRLSARVGMTVPVRGVLCFVGPDRIDRKDAAGGGEFDVDLDVVTVRELLGTLHRRRELSDEQIARIRSAAHEPTTWHDAPRMSTPGPGIAREFDALHAELGAKVERRLRERTAENVGTRAARRTGSRAPSRAGAARLGTQSPPDRAGITPDSTMQAARRSPPTSTGAKLLTLWPLLVASIGAVTGSLALTSQNGLFEAASGGLLLAWLLVFALPVLSVVLDRRALRSGGAPAASPFWVVLGPVGYLIARTVVLRRAHYAASEPLVLHLVLGVAGGVIWVVGGIATGLLLALR